MVKLIIAGSRTTVPHNVEIDMAAAALYPLHEIGEVLCGMAKGADLAGKRWAEQLGIRVTEYPAQWETLGKSAGVIRNKQMAGHADGLVAFWDGESHGTKHMIDTMRSMKKPYVVVCHPLS